MTPPGPEAVLLREIADAVASLVRKSDRSEFGRKLGMGADGTPTKWVDDVAEREVLRLVEQSDVELNVLSEESGFVDHGAERTLVVDPIDGTTNALRGIPVFCVSLAICTDRLADVDLALVRNVPTGETFEATRDEGATLDGRTLTAEAAGDGRFMVSLRAGRGGLDPARLDELFDAMNVRDHRHLGSATLEMCYVAQGALDLYVLPHRSLRVTDVAASALVLREAGGFVVDLDGQDLDMPLDIQARTPVVAARTRRGLDVLEVLA